MISINKIASQIQSAAVLTDSCGSAQLIMLPCGRSLH